MMALDDALDEVGKVDLRPDAVGLAGLDQRGLCALTGTRRSLSFSDQRRRRPVSTTWRR